MQLYMSEIFPTRLREGGIAVGTATQWLFNFAFSQITPHAVDNLGWKTFLMFAIFNFALVAYTWYFIKEVSGMTAEFLTIIACNRGATDSLTFDRPKGSRSRRWRSVSTTWPYMEIYVY